MKADKDVCCLLLYIIVFLRYKKKRSSLFHLDMEASYGTFNWSDVFTCFKVKEKWHLHVVICVHVKGCDL